MNTKTKSEISKKVSFNAYVLKEMFLYNLKICEARLCIMLTSKKATLDELTFEEKAWCFGNKTSKYLIKSVNKLIQNGLIDKDGRGFDIKGKEFVCFHSSAIHVCYNFRELFVKCMFSWYKKGKYISIKKEYIYSVFGEEARIRNQNIKRIKEMTGMEFSLEERKNDFLLHKPKSPKSSNKPYIPYKEYLQTEHWKTVSQKYKEKYGKCQLCGSTNGLNVHHNNYDCLWDETDKDLIVLCLDCRKKFHNIP